MGSTLRSGGPCRLQSAHLVGPSSFSTRFTVGREGKIHSICHPSCVSKADGGHVQQGRFAHPTLIHSHLNRKRRGPCGDTILRGLPNDRRCRGSGSALGSGPEPWRGRGVPQAVSSTLRTPGGYQSHQTPQTSTRHHRCSRKLEVTKSDIHKKTKPRCLSEGCLAAGAGQG